ncbi:ankyrin, partial [Fistulina hepatica ATCC 64428]
STSRTPSPVPDHDELVQLDPEEYRSALIQFFVATPHKIPKFLIDPPPNFDPDIAIDEDGHNALHWACSLGQVRVIKMLLSIGASVFKVNEDGQTALMRSVMFPNNYDSRRFPEVFGLLSSSVRNVDNRQRSILHLIVNLGASKDKEPAAHYYMTTVLQHLSPLELTDIINFPDANGDTPLAAATRLGLSHVSKLLIRAGANLHEDKIRLRSVEDARVSPQPRNKRQRVASLESIESPSPMPSPVSGPPPIPLPVSDQARTYCMKSMLTRMEDLAATFDDVMREKERDERNAKTLVDLLRKEILEARETVRRLVTRSAGLPRHQQTLNVVVAELSIKMNKRYHAGWRKWVAEEESRESSTETANWLAATNHALSTDSGSSSLSEKALGKRKADDISDLEELYSNIPASPQALAQACDDLRSDIMRHRERRKAEFNEILQAQAEMGNSRHVEDYRRLIAAGCNISLSQVDSLLPALTEV